MLKKEWQNIRKSKWMMLVLAAIILIPTLYTTIFLGSMWDPYGETEHLPVAVVNNDKSINYNGTKMEVGKELVKNLKKSGSMDFHFVNETEAASKLRNGTYYMVITIPENFSKNASTLLDDHPKKMELQYRTNPGTNYIASKMDETAVNTIRTQTADQVTKTYTETMFRQVKTAAKGFGQAADGAGQINSGARKLSKGNNTITKNLNTLASSSLTFKNGADSLQVGLKKYTDGVDLADQGAEKLDKGAGRLSKGAESLKSGAKDLKNGTGTLKNGVTDYTDGVGNVYAGSSELGKNSSTLNSGVRALSEGIETLESGSGSVLAGLKTMSSELGKSLTPEKQQQAKQLAAGMKEAADQLDPQAASGAETAQTGKNAGELSKETSNLTADANELRQQIADLKNSSGFRKLSQEEQQSLISGLEKSADSISSDAKTIEDKAAKVKSSASAESSTKASGAGQTQKIAYLLRNGSQTISSLSSGLGEVKTNLDKTGTKPKDMGLIQGMQAVYQGTGQMKSKVDGNSGLKEGVKAYTQGVAQVNGGLKQLDSKSAELKTGASALDKGAGQMTGKLPDLFQGMADLKNGTLSLCKGTSQLTGSSQALLNGSGQLSSGAKQISSGAEKLADGSKTVGGGIAGLKDGSRTLKTKLTDGAKEAGKVKDSKNTVDMFASPVKTEHSQMSRVQNNGHAMAPYMMSVALYVACIAFCLMFPLKEHDGEVRSGFGWWLSKASVMAAVAAVQAVVMVIMLMLINGLEPKELLTTFFMAVLVSMTFMAVITFFNLWLDKVGSFIVLVFMVLQLGGAAGTYPIELSPKFYQIIHPFMPFTYSVNAFRNTLMIGGGITAEVLVFIGILIVFSLLSIGYYQRRAKEVRVNSAVITEG
ncbi:YhgE/Pip domain-containing protein [Anaerostipes sp.]|uniref:YhgE/Pip domain-containing protein n=1 Tax=Anaerostipes sp. TaxID=1872530 RepID=UPI0025C65DF0|nr:YhgE/Pip domain-containing protein [Anaerostipes sp.]MBS7009561.1 YhgE/Pip domain-containing protein [Anaerostipes sp.]